jgi:glucan phosphoethanolaminetransferase (alkaline phosphatase superfamily)
MNTDRRASTAVIADTLIVVLFVAVGRRNHDQDPALSGTFTTAAPFLIALVLGWLAARVWQRPLAVVTGVIVWAVTLVGGMLLRNLVFDRGTATSFVIVTALFLGAGLIGYRVVAAAVTSRRRAAT